MIQQNIKIIWSKIQSSLIQIFQNQLDIVSLVQWLQSGGKGTFLKTLYLSQIEWNTAWSDIIGQKGLSNMTLNDWKDLLPSSSRLQSHAAYLLRKCYEFKQGMMQRIRRRRVELLGIKVPILPTITNNNQKLKDKLLGSIHINDKDPTIDMSEQEFIQKLEEGYIYIGEVVEREVLIRVNGSTQKLKLKQHTEMRVLSIRKVLIQLLLQKLEDNLLKLDKQEITIRFCDWWDEKLALSKGLFVWLIHFVEDSDVFHEDSSFESIVEPHPWMVGFIPVTIENVQHLREVN